MANTTSGWPYVVPADHPLEFPASSQALANLLEARVGAQGVTTKSVNAVLNSGWAGTVGFLRVGKLVLCTIDNLRKGSAPTASEAICTIPAGYRPVTYLGVPTVNASSASATLSALIAGISTVNCLSPAPAQTFSHWGTAIWQTTDAWPA